MPRFDNWTIRAGSSLLAVDQATEQISIDYQEQIPQNLRATSRKYLTHLACLIFTIEHYNTEYYGLPYGMAGQPLVNYTRMQYKHAVEIVIVDLRGGDLVVHRKFYGSAALFCPRETNQDLKLYGGEVN